MTRPGRLPLVGGLVGALRGGRASVAIEAHVVAGPDARPALRLTVANPGPDPVSLESVGMVFKDGAAFGDWVGVDLAPGGDPRVCWYPLLALEARISHADPLTGLTEIFAATSQGTTRVRVDHRRLRAELAGLGAERADTQRGDPDPAAQGAEGPGEEA